MSTMKACIWLLPLGGALWVAGAGIEGCYAPKFENGKLKCSTTNECPSGYQCMNQFCYKNGTTAGPMDGGSGGTGGGGMGGGGGGDADGGLQVCFGPIANCATMNQGSCDPVCQVGCKCKERCAYDGNTGNCFTTKGPFQQVGESCKPGTADVEQCRPGSVCLGEIEPACGSHCYRYCRVDSDCGDKAKCFGQVVLEDNKTTYNICSPQIEPACIAAGRAECPGMQKQLPTFGCYILSAKYPDDSVCDCAGSKVLGEACTSEHECVPGTECVRLGMEAKCRQICAIGGIGLLGCKTAGQTCTPFKVKMGDKTVDSARYGYCS